MQLKTMYPAQPNTPETTLAGALTTAGTNITVLDGAALPDPPNLLTIGADTSTAETVLMTEKNGNSLTVERGYNGTTPRAWTKGDIIGRYFTAADQDTMQANIRALNEGKPDNVENPTAGNLVAFDGSTGKQKDSGKKPDDFAPASHSHSGYVEKVTGPTAGNLVAFDGSTGQQKDSGKKPDDFAPASHSHSGYVEKVTAPTAGNLVAFDGSTGQQKDSGKRPEDFAPASHSHEGYAKLLIFTNKAVEASAWASSPTYPAFPYAAVIDCTGVTADYFPEVTFGVNEATGGSYAPVAHSGSGTVTIFAAGKPSGTITIPSIKCERSETA